MSKTRSIVENGIITLWLEGYVEEADTIKKVLKRLEDKLHTLDVKNRELEVGLKQANETIRDLESSINRMLND